MEKCSDDEILDFIRGVFKKDKIPLHEPKFIGNEKAYLNECIDTGFVSSVGKFVDKFETEFAKIVGSKYAVATVNGTAALHIALKISGVKSGDLVLTQPLTFIATCNAISYLGAEPVFIDVDRDDLGLSPTALGQFLKENCEVKNGICLEKLSGKIVRACVPMHTFGFPCKIDDIKEICDAWSIALIEDAAESLGSYYKGKHAGVFGKLGAFSFNGNKIVTSGGGGAIVTNDENLAKYAKHITTTAKIQHPYEYRHDEIGYNYRMPNINAALLVAQLENLELFLDSKRRLAAIYREFFAKFSDVKFIDEPQNARANFWLNAVLFEDTQKRDRFLKLSNESGVFTRPIWRLMSELDMFKNCRRDGLENAKFLSERVVNLPSSARA
ncbi:MAG: LegC family aminotransferase [Campylobacter sp.]